jgi:PAS domain S-box-containing protein
MHIASLWERIEVTYHRGLSSWPRRYGFVLLAVAMAAMLQLGLHSSGFTHLPYAFFVPLLVLVPLLAGLGPGIMATVLSTVVGGYFLFSPVNSKTHPPEDLARPVLFLVAGTVIAAITSGRMSAKRALRVTENDLTRAQEVAQIGSWHFDAKDGRVRLSDEAHRILGLSKYSILPMQAREMIYTEDRERVDATWHAVLESGNYNQENRVLVNGQIRWLRIQASLERNPKGGARKATGTVQDITEWKLAQQRLQEYEQTSEGVEEMIVVIDSNYRYITANRAFLNNLGIKQEELVGRDLPETMGVEAFENIRPKLEECLYQGRVVNFEKRSKVSPVGERHFTVSYLPLTGPLGVERIAITMKDITQRKQADEKLKLFRTLIDQSNDAVEVVDPETLRFLDVNERACKDLGYTREEMLKLTVFDIDPDADETVHQRVIEQLRGGEAILLQRFHRRKDGTTFPVEVSLRLAQLDRSYVVSIARDITRRKVVESALQESEDRYRDLVENSEDLLCTHDLEGNLLSVNPAPARILGYTVEEMMKIPMREMIVPEGRVPFDQYLERLRTTGAPEKGLLLVMTKTGEVRIWEYYNTLRIEGVEKPVVRGMAHDITARKQAEAALRKSEERFRVALKQSPVTVFNQDRDLRYTWIYNPNLHLRDAALGKTDEEILGKKAAQLHELKRRVLDTGEALREEVVIPHDGRSYAIDLTIEPLFDTEKKIVGITGASMDIARLREAKDRLAQEKSYLESEIETELGFEEIVGQSPPVREVLKKARIVAPIDSTVLLLGESGTGKELVARAVHTLSPRHEKNFIKLNCAAVPSGLLESELFGHERGAFTGAVSQKIGRVELADKGTLFLDEIGELPLELQPKLLRLLQDREFERLGGVRTVHVDVRIISATNRDLQKEVAERRFREDLFYRLNVFPIQMPTLRERRSDIPILVQHFVHKHSVRMGKHIEEIPPKTAQVLENWNWPGNIRELENMIERMVILSNGPVLADPPEELLAPQGVLEDNFAEMERDHIVRILRETNGVLAGQDGAAMRLGLKRTTLQSMIKRFRIEPNEYRRSTGASSAE